MWSAGPSWTVRTEVGPCKPMMLTWVTFYIINSREPPPFWKKFQRYQNFWNFRILRKLDSIKKWRFLTKKVENIFRKFRSNFWEKNFSYLNSKSPGPSNDRVITKKIHLKILKIFIKFSLSISDEFLLRSEFYIHLI